MPLMLFIFFQSDLLKYIMSLDAIKKIYLGKVNHPFYNWYQWGLSHIWSILCYMTTLYSLPQRLSLSHSIWCFQESHHVFSRWYHQRNCPTAVQWRIYLQSDFYGYLINHLLLIEKDSNSESRKKVDLEATTGGVL